MTLAEQKKSKRTGPRLTAALPLITASLAVIGQANIAREFVDPFIGTAGHGHTFPGACVPNGMVQLSPDTRSEGVMDWDGASGYHYHDSIIYGFSHTHLSGTGVSDLCDVLLMPVSDAAALDPKDYRSPFKKANEEANAGFYKVLLDAPKTLVELSSTARVGMHRYTFPRDKEARIVLDLRHRDRLLGSTITQVSATEVIGERRSSSWASDQRLFYCIRFDHPITSTSRIPSELVDQTANFGFGILDTPLLVKVGISAVSAEAARANLESELSHWSFDDVRASAEAAWNVKLNRITIEGGTLEQKRTFYTALYHSYLAPFIFNDVDGHYRGMDGEIHHADHPVYTVFSLWDTFRALHPLMAILEPEMTRDWIRTFLLHYAQGGRLPVWELWGNETDCMIGHHSVSVIADAYLKGIRGFDAKLALEAMVATADMDHFGLKAYRERGFISSEDGSESVSKTLEYAYNDACIARMADALGEQAIAERFHARSRNWQNLYDPSTKFFRPRRNGGFIEPFDPYEVNFHYAEANAWHYSLFVPHDMGRFISLLGNASGLSGRLDALFGASTSTTGRTQSDITGLIGQYAHGNEPSHNFAYLYNLSDRPASTDVFVAKIMRELYSDRPNGLSGNEDCGQMSAWYVLSALGIYPIAPGIPEYSLGLPLFNDASVKLTNGRTLRISGTSESGDRSHFESSTWNGAEHDRYRTIDHGAFIEGGHLNFELGPRPGSAPRMDSMEEMPADVNWVPVPFIQADGRTFSDRLVVSIGCSDPAAQVEYRTDSAEWQAYTGPITVLRSMQLSARASRPGVHGRVILSKPATAEFVQLTRNITMDLQSSYYPAYPADGDNALLDGLRGGNDFHTGEWQGFYAKDIVASLDLGSTMRIGRLGIGVLQDIRSWIWYPLEVEFNTSTNGRQWSSTIVRNTVPVDSTGAQHQDLWSEPINKRARYIEVTVRSLGPCPEWHPGAGKGSFLFADEILFELD